LGDYAFFGEIYKWPPSEIEKLGWSRRKKLKQAIKDSIKDNK